MGQARDRGWLRWALRLYLLGLLVLALLLHRLSDNWWPATVLAFAPRWPWGLPLLVLVPLVLLLARRQWPVALLAALVWGLGVMGFNLPAPGNWLPQERRADLRVMSYNIGEVQPAPQQVLDLLARLMPDVVLLQECGEAISEAKPWLQKAGWVVDIQSGSCLVSRLPLRRVQARDLQAIWKMGGSGVAVRYELQAPGLAFSVVNLHLETPRTGLQKLLQRGVDAADAMADVTAQRELEATLAQAFAAQVSEPLVITGDFNMPHESALFRRHFGAYTNAFDQAGWGLGYTKHTSWHGIRIDHVLAGPGWDVHAAAIGPHVGGDHRPLLAELSWVGQGR
jgi:endonuclease/exonuclease/phosphatase (EEP) superfamily protein YafD